MIKKEEKSQDEIPQDVFEEIVLNFLRNFKTFGALHGLDEDNLEAMYAAGYNYYNHGKYQEALDLFMALKRLNHFEAKYVMAIGACKQMLKDWQGAIDNYGLVLHMTPLNPVPAFHCAECLLQLKDVEGAKKAFQLTIDIANISEDKEYDNLKKQAENLLKNLGGSTVKKDK